MVSVHLCPLLWTRVSSVLNRELLGINKRTNCIGNRDAMIEKFKNIADRILSSRIVFFCGISFCAVFAYLSAKNAERPAWEQALAVSLALLACFFLMEILVKRMNSQKGRNFRLMMYILLLALLFTFGTKFLLLH